MKYFPYSNGKTSTNFSGPLDTHYTVWLPFAIIATIIIVIRKIAYGKMISEWLIHKSICIWIFHLWMVRGRRDATLAHRMNQFPFFKIHQFVLRWNFSFWANCFALDMRIFIKNIWNRFEIAMKKNTFSNQQKQMW